MLLSLSPWGSCGSAVGTCRLGAGSRRKLSVSPLTSVRLLATGTLQNFSRHMSKNYRLGNELDPLEGSTPFEPMILIRNG